MKILAAVAIAIACAAPAVAAAPPAPATPLFAAPNIIRLTISGPMTAFARGHVQPGEQRSAVLTLAGGEAHDVQLAPRGITRLKRDVCQFPPLRVRLAVPAAPTSLLAGQRSLKLVTHCRGQASFQQNVLLEYAAYRLYNLITPASLRVRLAQIDYVEEDGRPMVSRVGFFIEDIDDAARRIGLREVIAGHRVPTASLSPPEAARSALFQYMIANLDWSMRSGPVGDSCCHNFKLAGATQSPDGVLVPMPYDFDFSGLVNAPYAVAPEGLRVSSVRNRLYRGHCLHNAELPAAAAEFRAKRGALLGVFGQIPGLEPATQAKAAAFLDKFFVDIASDASVTEKLANNCIN